jgi:hypothetical protein
MNVIKALIDTILVTFLKIGFKISTSICVNFLDTDGIKPKFITTTIPNQIAADIT